MPLGIDTSFMQYIDPELAGSGGADYTGTGEEFASPGATGVVGGADPSTYQKWRKGLAGFAAGFQDPGFAAREIGHDEDVARQQAFTRSQTASGQNFDLKKAAILAAQQLRSEAYRSKLSQDEEANRIRLQQTAAQQAKDDEIARQKKFYEASTLANPIRTSASPIGGLTLPNRVPTGDEGFANLQVAGMQEPELRNRMMQQQTLTSAEQAKAYGAHADAYSSKALHDMLAAQDDDAVFDAKAAISAARAQKLPANTYSGFVGKKYKELKNIMGILRPGATSALPMLPGFGSPTTGTGGLPPAEVDLTR